VTERELRELVEPLTQRHIVTGDVRKFRGRLKTALADDPDLVWLLRWCVEASPWHPYHHEVAHYIEDTFHVRLTDDGYEWTDE